MTQHLRTTLKGHTGPFLLFFAVLIDRSITPLPCDLTPALHFCVPASLCQFPLRLFPLRLACPALNAMPCMPACLRYIACSQSSLHAAAAHCKAAPINTAVAVSFRCPKGYPLLGRRVRLPAGAAGDCGLRGLHADGERRGAGGLGAARLRLAPPAGPARGLEGLGVSALLPLRCGRSSSLAPAAAGGGGGPLLGLSHGGQRRRRLAPAAARARAGSCCSRAGAQTNASASAPESL